jgi:SAM-dependent methyltransferase
LLPNTKVHGTDNNPALVDWSRRNLPFAKVEFNRLEPPLGYADASFELVYALSVFTHLTANLQHAWVEELSRVLKPGGHLLMSTHGERYLGRLTTSERERFAAGELVVKDNIRSPGTNMCSAYHPVAYVRDQLARKLELASFIPAGARGNPPQDLYILRKPRAAGN